MTIYGHKPKKEVTFILAQKEDTLAFFKPIKLDWKFDLETLPKHLGII